MRLEILVATLKSGYREEDLTAIMRWNTQWHRDRGISDVRYFVSEDRGSFVMMVPHQEAASDAAAKEWEASGVENETWWREMMQKVIVQGKSGMYHEAHP